MIRRALLLLFFSCTLASANNLTTFWASDGYKQPRDFCYPEGAASSTTTISRIWNGSSINTFGAMNQTVGFEVIGCVPGGSPATNVTVAMSSMTCSGGTSIVSVPVSSSNVTDTTTRPQQVFSAWYLQHLGGSLFPYGFNEYEERQYPLDMRVPCTTNVNNQCIPNPPVLWTNRLYANKFLPAAWVPEEEFLISSETVAAGNSKSWQVDTYISTNTLAGNCTGQFTIFEGASVSTAIPVFLKVYPATLPPNPTMNVIVAVSNPTTDLYLHGNEFPGVDTGLYLQGHQNLAKLFKAHGLTVMGDQLANSAVQYYPSPEYQGYVDTSAPTFIYNAANGYGNARGVNLPDPIYGVGGTYGTWKNTACSTSTLLGAGSFSVCMSSWTAYCQTHNLKCLVSTPLDETTPANIAGEINTLSTWLSTVTATGFNGQHLPFFQTNSLQVLVASAPFVADNVSATVWNTAAGFNTPATYETLARNIMSGNGPAGANGAIWRYNSGAIGFGATFAYDEAGEVPEADFLALQKKICYDGTCHGGFYFYLGNGWLDSSAGNIHRDIFNNPQTFGFAPSANTQWGQHSSNYCEGDGVLSFPGQIDPAVGISTTPSFGFNGGIATFTLKKIRDGINDLDLANMAFAVNPAATTAVINSLWSKALWEVQCFTTADCTYTYGDRTWAYGQDAYTRARETFLQIITGGGGGNQVNGIGGNTRLSGQVIIR